MTALIRIDRTWTGDPTDAPSRPIRFCSRCGHPTEDPPKRPEPFKRERVCARCGMGLMLSCSRDALPGVAAAFLIVTFELAVSAVSQAGEKFFGSEQELIGAPLLEVMTSPLGDDQLAKHVGQAAQRACPPVILPVRLARREGRGIDTMAARVATCGPPRAALITVEPS